MMQTILAIETATNEGSVCLKHADEVYFSEIGKENSQASQIVPLIESLLNQAGVWYPDLQAITATIGPGSFTGTRIGLGVARTIALSFPDLEIIPITTLECLTLGYEGDAKEIHVTLRAGKGEVYIQSFNTKDTEISATSNIQLIKPDALELNDSAVIIGNTELANAEPKAPSAQFIIEGISKLKRDKERHFKPLYIRPPDAKLPTKPYL